MNEEELTKEEQEILKQYKHCSEAIAQIRLQHPLLLLPNLSMDTPLKELQFYERLAKKQNLVLYLRHEITCLVARGGVVREGFNYKECEDATELIVEKNHMAQQVEQKNILKSSTSLMEHLVNKFIVAQKVIVCLECETSCCVPQANKPVIGCTQICRVCKMSMAQVYQPECGHVLLCQSCFTLSSHQ